MEFTPEGVTLAPALPFPAYRFGSPLLGLERAAGGYEGWYAPLVAGGWEITLKPDAGEAGRLSKVTVNGSPAAAGTSDDGLIRFRGASAPDAPLRGRVE